jgi:hypothetical protein
MDQIARLPAAAGLRADFHEAGEEMYCRLYS